ncbi:bestrophin-like domain [Roseiarcus sp.]|uniref:bestrophin-like domain n=1 Tax=Roseiarcus sp. TaxID=1969460 RepID=UPI003F94975A
MSAEKVAFAIAVAIFAGGSIGLILQRALPEKYTTGGPRDMIGAVVGLLTLLSALVLGLLIWTAYGVYAGQNMAVQTLASKVLHFDMALADYGPEADPVRKQLRDGVGKTLDEVWAADQSDANFAANNFAAALRNLRARETLLGQLHPTTDAQTQALASARADLESLGQSRLQMSFALTAPICFPLVFTVVAWVVFLFLGYGLMSKSSATSVLGVVIGSLAMASAFLMILDLSNPYSGIFRASSAPLEQVLAVMGKE